MLRNCTCIVRQIAQRQHVLKRRFSVKLGEQHSGLKGSLTKLYMSSTIDHKMSVDIPRVEDSLEVEELDENLYRCKPSILWRPVGSRGVFGGQIIGLALVRRFDQNSLTGCRWPLPALLRKVLTFTRCIATFYLEETIQNQLYFMLLECGMLEAFARVK